MDLVNILNEEGNFIGTKERSLIDRKKDILHCAYIFISTPNGKIALSKIPNSPDTAGVERLYKDKLGVTVAVIIRAGESPDDAAQRGLEKETFIKEVDLISLGQSFETFPDNVRRLVSAYLYQSPNETIQYNEQCASEMIYLTSDEINEKISTEVNLFAPSFITLWKKYPSFA